MLLHQEELTYELVKKIFTNLDLNKSKNTIRNNNIFEIFSVKITGISVTKSLKNNIFESSEIGINCLQFNDNFEI